MTPLPGRFRSVLCGSKTFAWFRAPNWHAWPGAYAIPPALFDRLERALDQPNREFRAYQSRADANAALEAAWAALPEADRAAIAVTVLSRALAADL